MASSPHWLGESPRRTSAFPDPPAAPADADAIAVENRLKKMLYESRLRPSETGMESPITTGIRALLEAYGAVAVSVIEAHWRTLASTYPDDFDEMLIQLGRSEHEPTREARRLLIEQALEHPDPGTRDSATLGLDALEDPASEPALRKAAQTEQVPPIKTMLEEMLRDISQSG